jgi:hypothetical protein
MMQDVSVSAWTEEEQAAWEIVKAKVASFDAQVVIQMGPGWTITPLAKGDQE